MQTVWDVALEEATTWKLSRGRGGSRAETQLGNKASRGFLLSSPSASCLMNAGGSAEGIPEVCLAENQAKAEGLGRLEAALRSVQTVLLHHFFNIVE